MMSEKVQKNHLNKENNGGFKIPENYFESFEDRMMYAVRLKSKTNNPGYLVPDNYFEELEDRIISSIKERREPKVIQLGSWKYWIAVAAVVAGIFLMIDIFSGKNDSSSFKRLETASIEYYISDEDFSDYELASLLELNQLSTENFVKDVISEDNLKDYLLENADLESLINE